VHASFALQFSGLGSFGFQVGQLDEQRLAMSLSVENRDDVMVLSARFDGSKSLRLCRID
jgi:hypothetical protein